MFNELGMRVKKVEIPSRFPVLAMLNYLDHEPCDLLVLATEGREGIARWLRDSVGEALARSSHTMTLFVPAEAERGLVSLADGDLSLNSVLVPVDHNPNPRPAVEFARRVAEVIGDAVVPITLLHVGDQDDGPDLDVSDGDRWAFEGLHRSGDPVEQILDVATRTAANLIVTSTSGHHGVLDALRGGTTEHVLRQARCPVLAVPV